MNLKSPSKWQVLRCHGYETRVPWVGNSLWACPRHDERLFPIQGTLCDYFIALRQQSSHIFPHLSYKSDYHPPATTRRRSTPTWVLSSSTYTVIGLK
jgi:hypothetical protein